jgi:hypothetical protein
MPLNCQYHLLMPSILFNHFDCDFLEADVILKDKDQAFWL